jgi:acetyl-CoA carboxylase, biotin carboxylase subunit
MLESILVANRGEIARRIVRTARRLGIRSVAVYSEADSQLPHVKEADESYLIGPAAPAESYCNAQRLLKVAAAARVDAIHPGYGFLSENASFARAVTEAGYIWVGPSSESIKRMGNKVNARGLMAAAGVPIAAGTEQGIRDSSAAVAAGQRIGFPLIVKAAAGGGGMGIAVAHNSEQLTKEFESIHAFAERTFGDPHILLERFLVPVRHIEVQILGLANGRIIALGERECSVQRRNQKVVEEAPSPGMTSELRARMLAAAVSAGQAVDYQNAGTVECLVSGDQFVFLEMNTRIQVEHPITEAIFGVDLVEQQLRIASGENISFDPATLAAHGHAIELRICAEDPQRFYPCPGVIKELVEPTGCGIRVDSGYTSGNAISRYYDSLVAKLVIHGDSREDALEKLRCAISKFLISGPKCNLAFFAELVDNDEFVSGRYDTGIVGRMRRPRQ